ncbi:MAG: hypothetical protein FJ297_10285 [Planctomycetes bacterium]|nr:hypothetical protein [Planctomycetota bacterium]
MTIRRSPRWAGALRAVVCGCVLACGGCRGNSPEYRAGALPAALMAVPAQGFRHVDLSRLATHVPDSNILQPGDLVKITVATGLEVEEPVLWNLRLGDDGAVHIPLIGPVAIAGLAPTEAERVIHDESVRRGKFVDPNVSVMMLEPRSHRVTVVGAVKKPGTYRLPATNSNILAALVAAEGLAEQAGTVIEVRHPAPNSAFAGFGGPVPGFPNGTGPVGAWATPAAAAAPFGRTDTIDLTIGPAIPGDTRLEDGATVMVRPKESRFVFVNGLVRKPDRYELPDEQDLRLLDALALAGGRTMEIADEVKIVRQTSQGGEPAVIIASVRDAKQNGAANLRLAPGDVLTVEETPTTFVIGTIREFVRFGFTSAIPGF